MLRRTLIILLGVLFLSSNLIFGQNQQNQNNQKRWDAPVEKKLIDFANLPSYLSVDKWKIVLSGYSDNPISRKLSDLKIVDVDSGKLSTDEKFSKALGVHIYYEYSHGNDWAQIKPKMEINQFYAKEGEGIVRNVGPIKSVSILVSGRNYSYSIEVRMVNQDGKFKSINFGTLWFKGWKKLTWNNPNYIKDKKKRDIIKVHLYPQYAPYLKLDSIIIYKSPQEIGGDFVTYIKDVRIEYEPLMKKIDMPVADEKEWGIKEKNAKEAIEKLNKWNDIRFSGSSYEEEYKKEKAEKEKNGEQNK